MPVYVQVPSIVFKLEFSNHQALLTHFLYALLYLSLELMTHLSDTSDFISQVCPDWFLWTDLEFFPAALNQQYYLHQHTFKPSSKNSEWSLTMSMTNKHQSTQAKDIIFKLKMSPINPNVLPLKGRFLTVSAIRYWDNWFLILNHAGWIWDNLSLGKCKTVLTGHSLWKLTLHKPFTTCSQTLQVLKNGVQIKICISCSEY